MIINHQTALTIIGSLIGLVISWKLFKASARAAENYDKNNSAIKVSSNMLGNALIICIVFLLSSLGGIVVGVWQTYDHYTFRQEIKHGIKASKENLEQEYIQVKKTMTALSPKEQEKYTKRLNALKKQVEENDGVIEDKIKLIDESTVKSIKQGGFMIDYRKLEREEDVLDIFRGTEETRRLIADFEQRKMKYKY